MKRKWLLLPYYNLTSYSFYCYLMMTGYWQNPPASRSRADSGQLSGRRSRKAILQHSLRVLDTVGIFFHKVRYTYEFVWRHGSLFSEKRACYPMAACPYGVMWVDGRCFYLWYDFVQEYVFIGISISMLMWLNIVEFRFCHRCFILRFGDGFVDLPKIKHVVIPMMRRHISSTTTQYNYISWKDDSTARRQIYRYTSLRRENGRD